MKKIIVILLSWLCLMLCAIPVLAESIKLTNTSGDVITADFSQGFDQCRSSFDIAWFFTDQ